MKVTSVEYGATRSTTNYGNNRLSVVVELENDDSPEEAYRRALRFVESRLDPSRRDAVAEVERLRARLAQLGDVAVEGF